MQKSSYTSQLIETHIKSAVPLYFSAAVWVLCALFLPLYRITDFAIVAVLSVLMYIIAGKWFPGRKTLTAVPLPPLNTGNPEADKMIADGRVLLDKINALSTALIGTPIQKQVARLEEVTVHIFEYIEENPRQAGQVRKFLNYFLPTTVKLLTAYQSFLQQPVQGENIQSSVCRIEEMIDSIVRAFEKQMDSLFMNQALDISADITVLEGMLSMEGLLEQPHTPQS